MRVCLYPAITVGHAYGIFSALCHIVISGLSGCTVFSHISSEKLYDFQKKNIKCLFSFCLQT
jgi:hypothetical protein